MGLFGSKSKLIASQEERVVAQYAQQDALKPPMSSELNERLLRGVKDNWPLLVKQTLEKGASPELVWKGSYHGDPEAGNPVLSIAVRNVREEIVQLLLDFKANPNRELGYGTYLWQATMKGNSRMVRMLLDAGADPQGHSQHQSWQDWPIEIARRNYFTDIVQMIEQEPARRQKLAAEAAAQREAAERAAQQAVIEQQRAETAAEVTKRITVGKPLQLKGVKPVKAAAPQKSGWRKLLG